MADGGMALQADGPARADRGRGAPGDGSPAFPSSGTLPRGSAPRRPRPPVKHGACPVTSRCSASTLGEVRAPGRRMELGEVRDVPGPVAWDASGPEPYIGPTSEAQATAPGSLYRHPKLQAGPGGWGSPHGPQQGHPTNGLPPPGAAHSRGHSAAHRTASQVIGPAQQHPTKLLTRAPFPSPAWLPTLPGL